MGGHCIVPAIHHDMHLGSNPLTSFVARRSVGSRPYGRHQSGSEVDTMLVLLT